MANLESTNPELRVMLDRAEAATQFADRTEPRAVSAHYDPTSGNIVIHLKDGATYMFPHHLGQGLADADPADLNNIEITPFGTGLHWPTLDVDLTVPSLLQGIYGTKSWMEHLRQKQNVA